MNVIQPKSAIKQQQEAADAAAKRGGGADANLNLYHDNPNVELSLDDFEVFALKRLKVLRKIEQLRMMRVPFDQSRQKIDQILKQELADPAIDELSHFILRIAYCETEELRRWFLAQETALFQHRLNKLSESQLVAAVSSMAQLKPISNSEKTRLQDHLLQLMNPSEFASSKFFAVPFQEALDLVATRQCYLHAGYAYIPQAKVVSILTARFRTELSRQMTFLVTSGAFKSAGESGEASRVYPLLKNLNKCLVTNEPNEGELGLAGGTERLNARSVETYVSSMPLCMREAHAGLKRDKKLRHWARLQYGLFLKGAGLSMEESIAYFQRAFSSVTAEQFQKNYAYNVRHMYGKEGKRATYTPYNCNKIINGNAPMAGEHHGCPYRHYDADHLGSLLSKLQIGTPQDRNAILALKKQHQYQLACQKHFEVMHPKAATMDHVSLDNVGNHPNAWFRASVAFNEGASSSGGAASAEAVVAAADSAAASPSS